MRSLFAPLGLGLVLGLVGCGGRGAGRDAEADSHGVGATCQSSADCAESLFCNSDPVDHLLDQRSMH